MSIVWPVDSLAWVLSSCSSLSIAINRSVYRNKRSANPPRFLRAGFDVGSWWLWWLFTFSSFRVVVVVVVVTSRSTTTTASVSSSSSLGYTASNSVRSVINRPARHSALHSSRSWRVALRNCSLLLLFPITSLGAWLLLLLPLVRSESSSGEVSSVSTVGLALDDVDRIEWRTVSIPV